MGNNAIGVTGINQACLSDHLSWHHLRSVPRHLASSQLAVSTALTGVNLGMGMAPMCQDSLGQWATTLRGSQKSIRHVSQTEIILTFQHRTRLQLEI